MFMKLKIWVSGDIQSKEWLLSKRGNNDLILRYILSTIWQVEINYLQLDIA